MSKIVSLHDKDLSPTVVLARTMEKAKQIKAVMVLIEWADPKDATHNNGWSADWSKMSSQELCFAAKIAERELNFHMDSLWSEEDMNHGDDTDGAA